MSNLDCCCPVVVAVEPAPITAVVVKEPQAIATVVAGTMTSNAPNPQYDPFIPTANQTSFPLTSTVINPQLSKVFVNGVKLTYLQTYNFTTAFSVLEFFPIEYQLQPTDHLEIYYFS